MNVLDDKVHVTFVGNHFVDFKIEFMTITANHGFQGIFFNLLISTTIVADQAYSPFV